ncbi:FAD-binding protein [Turicimonas muris]|uniref:FAD-binding protein n=1 Tax=Turicimonas muris TaxID=1796652 RepID=UPI00080F1397|nr:FAD-binding protein [Turicimonas muris]QQQ96557.1 FAD-binding protein [Turicimonas muris]
MAEAEGISYKNLEKTIRIYNEDVAKGKDSEYGRTKLLQTIDTAPYYAFECEPQIYTSYSGLEINKKAQVLNEAGVPIKGLYAAGDVTGHLAYQSGLGGGGISGLVMATVYGKIAGEEAAKN